MFDEAKLEEIIAAGVRRGVIEANAEMLSMQAESAKDSGETQDKQDKPKKTRKRKERVEEPPKEEEPSEEETGFDDELEDPAEEETETGTDSDEEISKEDFVDEVKRIFKGNVVLAKEFMAKKFKCNKFANFEQKNYAKFLKLAKKDNA